MTKTRGKTIMEHDAAGLRRFRYAYERFLVGPERLAVLKRHNWYKNLLGGWVHPHCMDFMSRREILALSPAQLDYKLSHGSKATLPPELHERT